MSDAEEQVVLVNVHDQEIGTLAKLEAHRTGQLHRAFSVFITAPDGRILLQRRANDKYHSGGLWSNACCGHPRPGETTSHAAERRLKEEMGIECVLQEIAQFTYRADLGNGLVEHELDHVLHGQFSGDPVPHQDEVREWRWISPDDLRDWLARDRTSFTAWFTEAFDALNAAQ